MPFGRNMPLWSGGVTGEDKLLLFGQPKKLGFAALKEIGDSKSLTLEAFGQSVPTFAAARKIRRLMVETEEKVAQDGLAFMKPHWTV